MQKRIVMRDDLHTLPDGLPAPDDDRGADHLPGARLPSVLLPATIGPPVDLSSLRGRVAVFAYPRTGRPDEKQLVDDWNMIPGARGCTPQTCGFRDLAKEFSALHCRIFGLSTQDTAYQQEMAERLHLPFPVLSDATLKLATALRLPTFTVAGQVLFRRLAWVACDGVIATVFYPVFPPDRNADDVLGWLRSAPHQREVESPGVR
jgi:peroxiredoxin